ncbi:hypothetical protein [Indioceanicola profundi]|uniref:hypothetical protein n=1 Tax=Indioceanicola profundi TaxID=2220096 RepID=UPI000E6ADF85|nr:hypothetical protein [Indioceanicola profundi]
MFQTADSNPALREFPGGATPVAVAKAASAVCGAHGRGLNGLLSCAMALLVAAGLLVSCAERPQEQAQPLNTQVAVLPPPDPAPALAPTSPVPKAKPKPKPVAIPAVVLPQQRPEPVDAASQQTAAVAAKIDPGVLVGMTEAETLDLLGQPAWTQEIPPAKTWQYASERCVLRVFMFMEMTTRDFRTLSYELTSTDEQPDVDQQCLAELVAQAWGEGNQHDAPRSHRTGG